MIMSDVGTTTVIAGITNILGIMFIVFCTLKKQYSWFFLLLSQTIWFIYSYYGLDKVDWISLSIIFMSIISLSYWHKMKFVYSSYIEKIIILSSSGLTLAFTYLYNPNLQFHIVVFQLIMIIGLYCLFMKFVDGWIVLMIANCFCWQNNTLDTISIIAMGIVVYGFGFYNWRKEVT